MSPHPVDTITSGGHPPMTPAELTRRQAAHRAPAQTDLALLFGLTDGQPRTLDEVG